MSTQELTDRVAARAGVDPAVAEKAIGTILSIIQLEGKGNKVGELFARLRGAADLAQKYNLAGAPPQIGVNGIVDGLVPSVFGNGANTLLCGISKLQSSGLTPGQIKTTVHEVFVFATENGGRSLVREVTKSIPGLRTQLAA